MTAPRSSCAPRRAATATRRVADPGHPGHRVRPANRPADSAQGRKEGTQHMPATADWEDPRGREGLRWRKASASTGNGQCVELAPLPQGVALRDSKDPQGPVLRFTREELAAFLDG